MIYWCGSFLLLFIIIIIIIPVAPINGRQSYFSPAEGRLLGSEGSPWNGSGAFSLRVELCSGKLKAYCLLFLPFGPNGLPHSWQNLSIALFFLT